MFTAITVERARRRAVLRRLRARRAAVRARRAVMLRTAVLLRAASGYDPSKRH